ncbi:MAG TPA: DUF1214 domain-containing protein [Mycobacterium sp.]|nr:DUF1214 domain-containing protein [Mycobacterium sp.]
MATPESSAAWHELLSAFADFDGIFLDGPRAVRGETAATEGYRWLAALLGQSLDMTLFADPVAPRFADLTTPFRQDRRLGGDNTDCYYGYAVIDPRRTYRVSGTPNDSDMYSLTVYNEPEPGAWPNKTVGLLYDQDMPLTAGRFSCMLGPVRPAGYDGPFIELSDDAHGILTRDYHRDPSAGRRVDWDIEVIDHAGLPAAPDNSDGSVAAALRAALRGARDTLAIAPLVLQERTPAELADGQSLSHNVLAPPYRTGGATYGYSMQDAVYCLGAFALEPDEALVIKLTQPACRFWNFTLWNQFMSAVETEYSRSGINCGSAIPNSDGSTTIVIARQLLEHPNALSTKDHAEGLMAFRWFFAADMPEHPSTTVLSVDQAPRTVS